MLMNYYSFQKEIKMKTKFFTKNNKGKVEFTEKELKKLLDEIYNEGYFDGRA